MQVLGTLSPEGGTPNGDRLEEELQADMRKAIPW